MRIPLRRRMQVAFLISILVTLIVGASFWMQSQEIEKNILSTQLSIVNDLRALQDLQQAIIAMLPELMQVKLSHGVQGGLSAQVNAAIKKVISLQSAVERRLRFDKLALAAVPAEVTRQRIQACLNRSKALIVAYRGIRRELADMEREFEGRNARLPVLRNRLLGIAKTLGTLLDGREAYLDSWGFKLKKRHELFERNTLLVIAIGLAFGIFFLFFATPDVVNPMKRFLVALREVREANFRARVAVEEQHELADVVDAFNMTLDRLEELEAFRSSVFRREREKFTQLATMVDEAVVVLDQKGRIAYMSNRAFAFFALSSEVLGYSIAKVDLPKEIKGFLENAFLRGVRAVHHKATVKPHGGASQEIEIFVSTSIIQDKKGAHLATLLILRPVGPPLNWPALA